MLELDASELEQWVQSYLAKLTPAQLRKLKRQMAMTLRRANVQRITRQQEPEGTPFAPRKDKSGKKMFINIKKAKYLKYYVNQDSITVKFAKNVTHIARVQHFGLRDVLKNGALAQYPSRELLGINKQDQKMLLDLLIQYLED